MLSPRRHCLRGFCIMPQEKRNIDTKPSVQYSEDNK